MKKASLFHLLISWIVVTGMFARYMAMALPEQSEWHPILCDSKPRVYLPSNDTAVLSFCLICEEDINNNLPADDLYALTFVASLVDG